MSATVRAIGPGPSPRRTLRVRLRGESEWMHRLRLRLSALGHAIVDGSAACDVVLAADDAIDAASDAGTPTVVIGNADAAARASHVAGVLDDGASDEQVEAALHAVAAGLLVQSRSGERGFGAAHERPLSTLLSPREAEVLAAIAEGDSNKMIARRLSISLHTVKFHVESVFRKLDARTRAEAVARAVDYGRRETIEL
jgi:DNA-binding CsgD family transcriptional regulator